MKNKSIWAVMGMLMTFLFVAAFTRNLPVYYEIAWIEGQFWYQPTGQVKWQKVENTDKKIRLNLTDKVKIGKETQVIIQAVDGLGHLLNKAGVWRLQQLIEKADAKTPSMVQQYLGFLMKHITQSEKSIDDYAEGYMRKKGLVSRGADQAAPLMLSPQPESVLDLADPTFIWKSSKNATAYTLALYDDWNGSPIWQKEVADTTFQINLDIALLERDRVYYWNVAPKNESNSLRYAFTRIKNEDLKLFEQKLNDLQTDLKYNNAMNEFVKAGLYEENQFYPEANRQFQNALRIQPNNGLFRQSYALFLARSGQVEEAKKYLHQQ